MKNVKPAGISEIFKVATPLIISMGSLTLMQFCDRIFLGWYSDASFQAALPAGILSFTIICFFMETAGYGNTFVAQYFGSGQNDRCSKATGQAFWIALASWPIMIALMPLGIMAIKFSGHPQLTIEEEMKYFIILMLGGGVTVINTALGSFFTGRGDTITTMTANLSANICNIFLAYVLIFGKCGFPELGIKGAAIATVISSCLSPIILLARFLSAKNRREFQTHKAFAIEPQLIKRIIRFGAPSAMNVVLDVASFTLFMFLVGQAGALELTTSNMAFSINNIVFMPLLGLSIATASLVGKYQGAMQPDLAAKSAWSALKVGCCYMAIMAVTFIALPEMYLSIFTKGKHEGFQLVDILRFGKPFLVMMAVWGLFDACNLIIAGALKGAGDTKFVMIYSFVMAWGLWVSGELLIIKYFGRNIMLMWIWLTVYVILLAIGYTIRFLTGRWKKIKVIEPHPASTPNHPGIDALSIVE